MPKILNKTFFKIWTSISCQNAFLDYYLKPTLYADCLLPLPPPGFKGLNDKKKTESKSEKAYLVGKVGIFFLISWCYFCK